MKILLFLGLALIEYIIINLFTAKITKLKEYVTINYSSFEFSDIGEKPYGLNILIRIICPTIFVVILSGIFYNFEISAWVENIYVITIFYFLIRWFVIICLLNRKELTNWKSEIFIFILTVGINLLVYYFFIKKTTQIFVSIDELRDAIWISIITFVIVVIKDFIYNHVYIENCKLENRKEKYILKKYEHFRNKYQDIIKTRNKELYTIVYAIMIYENFNRPFVIRCIEKIKFIITGRATLGIMQVNSRVLINDKTSVKLGYKRLKKSYFDNKKVLNNNDVVVTDTIASYNYGEKYLNEVLYIKEILDRYVFLEY